MRPSSHFDALVLAHPGAAAVDAEDVELAGLEGLARDRLVLVVAVDHAVPVEEAAPHRQVARPVVRVALELEPAARIGLGDRVGPAGDRVLADDLVEALGLCRRALSAHLRENTRSAADREQRVVAALAQVEADRALVEHHRPLHAGQRRAQAGDAYLPDSDSKLYFTSSAVTGSPLVKRAFGLQAEGDRRLVGRDAHRLGQQAVHRLRLVAAQHRQRLEHEDAHARRRIALDREGVELVEAGAPVGVAQVERAALGRVGVDVVEVREAGRVLRLAEGGVGPARWSARRRSAAAANRPAPWRSWRAGAARRTAGAGRHRPWPRGRGCRCAAGVQWRARAPRSAAAPRAAPAPRRSGCPRCTAGSAPSSAPERSCRYARRGCRASRARSFASDLRRRSGSRRCCGPHPPAAAPTAR